MPGPTKMTAQQPTPAPDGPAHSRSQREHDRIPTPTRRPTPHFPQQRGLRIIHHRNALGTTQPIGPFPSLQPIHPARHAQHTPLITSHQTRRTHPHRRHPPAFCFQPAQQFPHPRLPHRHPSLPLPIPSRHLTLRQPLPSPTKDRRLDDGSSQINSRKTIAHTSLQTSQHPQGQSLSQPSSPTGEVNSEPASRSAGSCAGARDGTTDRSGESISIRR